MDSHPPPASRPASAAGPFTPPLTYAPPPPKVRSRLAVASLVLGGMALVFGLGGAILFGLLTRHIRNRPTDLDYIPLQLLFVVSLVFVPPLGIICALFGLRRRFS